MVNLDPDDLKWYSSFVFFALCILRFADSITDIIIVVSILVLHETWLVATVFYCVQIVVFGYGWLMCAIGRLTRGDNGEGECWECAFLLFCVLTPFATFFARLQIFISVLLEKL